MEKRNTLLLTIIAIATLLVAVAGATFAYFASNIQTGNTLNVDVNTSASKASFTATSSDSIDIDVASYLMQQNNAENSVNNSANLVVNLTASDSGQITKCKYDIVWKWQDSDGTDFSTSVDAAKQKVSGKPIYPSKYYVRTQTDEAFTETFHEFTISGTQTVTDGSESGTSHSGDLLGGEKNIDNFTDPSSKDGVITLKANEELATDESVSVTYNFDVKFYNLNHDQSALKGKSFKAVISVDNVHC